MSGNGVVSGMDHTDSVLPAFSLEQNYPNPFNPNTIIRYQIPQRSRVRITVHDILGREIATLVDEIQEAGSHEQTFNASHLSNGVYFYSLSGAGKVQIRKMVLLK